MPLLTALGTTATRTSRAWTRAAEDMAARIAEGTPFSRSHGGLPHAVPAGARGHGAGGRGHGPAGPGSAAVIKLVEWNAGLGAQVRQAATYPC